jgi:hypothetical protein
MRNSIRITAASLALAVGLTGAAQAEPFNIFSASKAQEVREGGQLEQVRRRHGGRHGHYRGHRGWNPGAAFALGTIGAIAGAAAYSSRYSCDPYYEYCGPRRVYRRHYDGPRYYEPRRYYYYD